MTGSGCMSFSFHKTSVKEVFSVDGALSDLRRPRAGFPCRR